MMDNRLEERLARVETTLFLIKLALGALVVFLAVRFWGVEKPAQVGFIASLVLVVLWLLFHFFVSALKRKPGWSDDDSEIYNGQHQKAHCRVPRKRVPRSVESD